MSEKLLKHISERAQKRETVAFHGLPLREGAKSHPKPISLAGGRPDHGFYPITKITYDFISEPYSDGSDTKQLSFNQIEKDKEAKLDLKRALNYGPTQGHSQLLKFCKDLVTYANRPGYENWDVTLSCGSGDSLHKVFNLLMNPGDIVLMEAYTFVPVMNAIRQWGGDVVPVSMNFADGGIDVVALEEQLENWSTGPYKDKPKPKALYTIPTGQNPTGLTLKEEHRHKVYELAQKHDFIIVEDDPYGYIQLGQYTDGVENQFAPGKCTADEFVTKVLPKSFVEIDTEGRVLRLETFSKVFSPGSRVGFIVGYAPFIKNIVKHAEVSTKFPSGISQATILTTVDHFGGVKGWIEWCIRVSKTYCDRKNHFLKTLFESEAYKKGYFVVREPDTGMFVTVEINYPKGDDHRDELEQLRYICLEQGVVVVLGKNMAFTPEYAKAAQFLRLTFATAVDNDEIVEGASRLAKAILLQFTE